MQSPLFGSLSTACALGETQRPKPAASTTPQIDLFICSPSQLERHSCAGEFRNQLACAQHPVTQVMLAWCGGAWPGRGDLSADRRGQWRVAQVGASLTT